jgi:glycosyltransferase involved in cell wall biosynthesis
LSGSYVFLYGPTWDAPSQVSKHHLARHWASRGDAVLYVESQFHPLSLITRRSEVGRMWGRFAGGPVRVADNLWVQAYPSLMPYRSGVPFAETAVARWANQVVPKFRVRAAAHRAGIVKPVVVVGTATALPLVDRLDPGLVVYHCSDDYASQPNFPKSFLSLERSLTDRVDLVICTAEELRRVKAPLNPNTHTVTNGADVDHFSITQSPTTAIAPEIAGLPGPVIGYIGTVFEWLDIQLLARAARERPEWSFVFVGPIATDVSAIANLRNVHLLGPRPYADLPGYLKGFDVATVPFVVHDVTLRASPVKFYEYLASGVPVVATRLPDLERFEGMAELYTGYEQFMAALDRAVADRSDERRDARMNEASANSWDDRFAQIDGLIADALARRAETGRSGD